MHFTNMDYQYLSGQSFSNEYHMVFETNLNCSRIDKIVDLCRNKKVIHFGCCDHISQIKQNIEKNFWLQKILEEECETVVGIDINEEAINFVLENKYANNVYSLDLLAEPEKVTALLSKYEKFDYLLMGDVLEHIDDPVLFLKKIKQVVKPYCENVIITVPSALSENLNTKREYLNSDHRYWFTPYTIAKVMTCAEIKPRELYFAGKVNHIYWEILGKLLKNSKLLSVGNTTSSTLVVIGEL